MRRVSDEARALLSAATAVARFRGAQECDTSDLKVLTALHPGVALYPDTQATTPPQQMPLAIALQRVRTSSQDELHIEELRRLARNS